MGKFLVYKKKWKFYYAWYYLYILNKKIKMNFIEMFSGTNVNENEIFSEEIQDENAEDDIESVGSIGVEEAEKIQIKHIEVAFDKTSCVFYVDNDDKGKILKVNKPVENIFGYQAQELMNNSYIT